MNTKYTACLLHLLIFPIQMLRSLNKNRNVVSTLAVDIDTIFKSYFGDANNNSYINCCSKKFRDLYYW